MHSKWFKIIFVIIILGVLKSCGVLFLRKNEPIAKACFFDPILKSIIYKNKNHDGIKRIEIELLSFDEEITSVYLRKNYKTPVLRIDLSLMDTVLLMQNLLRIKIWDSSPIIEDYNLMIKSSDWQKGKLVYSRYSTR